MAVGTKAMDNTHTSIKRDATLNPFFKFSIFQILFFCVSVFLPVARFAYSVSKSSNCLDRLTQKQAQVKTQQASLFYFYFYLLSLSIFLILDFHKRTSIFALS